MPSGSVLAPLLPEAGAVLRRGSASGCEDRLGAAVFCCVLRPSGGRSRIYMQYGAGLNAGHACWHMRCHPYRQGASPPTEGRPLPTPEGAQSRRSYAGFWGHIRELHQQSRGALAASLMLYGAIRQCSQSEVHVAAMRHTCAPARLCTTMSSPADREGCISCPLP